MADGRLLHFSVSQLKDFRRCPRLWALGKIFKERPPQSPSQSRGTSLHKQPEAWLKAGIEPTHEAFLAARPGLPVPHVDLMPEANLVDPTLFVEGTRFEGHSDLIVPPHLGKRFGVPEVVDWKFVGSFRYMEDPGNDLQMLAYGYWVSRRWPEVREISLQLWYFMAEGSADFKPQKVVVPVERCEAEWLDIVVPTVRKMQAFVASAPAVFGAVPGNFSDNYAACRKYGGCYFASEAHCNVPTKSVKLSSRERELLRLFDGGTKKSANGTGG